MKGLLTLLFIAAVFVLPCRAGMPATIEVNHALQTDAGEVLSLVHAVVGDKAPIQQRVVDGRHFVFIGEDNHSASEYRQLSRALQQQAVEGRIALFKEALPRNVDAESMWALTLFGHQQCGYLFGAEDDLAYDISAWARELGLFVFSGGKRNQANSNGEFLYKFLFSPKAIQIWDQLVVESKGTPLENHVNLLDPQIKAFYEDGLAGKAPLPILQESLTANEWAVIHLGLLHIAAKDESLTLEARKQLAELLKDPLNPLKIVRFNEDFGRHYRSACMVRNILFTQPKIPVDKVIVVYVGLGHLHEIAGSFYGITTFTGAE